jgi:Na+/citrate or Na+/malate symporter
VLAALFFLLVAGNVLTSIIRPITITSASISGSVIFVVLTAAYLNSAIRLVRHPPLLLPESDPVQKWKPLKL